MLSALNPFDCLFPFHPVPKLTSSDAIREVLDVRTKAREYDYSPRLLEGNSSVHKFFRDALLIISIPLRIAMVILHALGQILRELPRHSLYDLPRVISLIYGATTLSLFITYGSYLRPFHSPDAQVRADNIIDVRSAGLYTQKPIPAETVDELFGVCNLSAIHNDARLSTMSGLCWGKSLWLASMFLHGERYCPDPEKRLKALTRQYDQGSTPESALVQALGECTWASPSLLERILGSLTSLCKPSTIQSTIRGTWRYLNGAIRDTGTLASEISRSRKVSKEAITIMGEHARLGRLLHLGARDTRRYTVRPLTGWRSLFFESYSDFRALKDLPDGVYILATQSTRGTSGHAIFYYRCDSGHRGYVMDPNEGLECLEGAGHWRKIADLAPRTGHNTLTATRIEKRDLLDCGFLDLRRRWAEICC